MKMESVHYGVAIIMTFFIDILESVVHVQTWSTLVENSKMSKKYKIN